MMPSVVLDLLAQTAAPTVQLDLGKLILAAIGTLLSALATAVIFFVKRLIASFDGFKTEVTGKFAGLEQNLSEHREHVEEDLGAVSQQMQRVTQEMFGPNGDNGMRGDLRRTKDLVVKHDRLLVRLADRAKVDFEED